MIIKKIYVLMVLLMAGVLSCTQTTGKTTTETEADEGQFPLYIKFEKPDIKSLKPLYLSEFVDKIDYVQLETLNQCLLPPKIGVNLTKDFIFVWSGYQLYQFDKEGKFIRQIGKKGQGPGEYMLSKLGFDDVNSRILVVSNTSATPLIFDYDGKFLGKVTDSLMNTYSWGGFTAGDGYFIYILPPMDVNLQQERKLGSNELVVYDYIKSEVTQTLPNRYVCEVGDKNQDHFIIPSLQVLTKHDGIFYYYSFYNDTLYAVDKNNIQPYAVFDFGKDKLENLPLHSPHVKELDEAKAGKMRIVNIFFHHDIIYFYIWISHNSAIAETFICKYDISSKQLTYHSWNIINDIDGNQNIEISELVDGIINARNPEEITNKNYRELLFSTLDKSELKYPEQKEELERMLKENIEKEDNPILMILHIK